MKPTLAFWLFMCGLITIILNGCATNEPPPELFNPVVPDQAPVQSIEVEISETAPSQVTVLVQGDLPGCALKLDSAEPSYERKDNTFFITLPAFLKNSAQPCDQPSIRYGYSIPLDVTGLPAGTYIVNTQGLTTTFELAEPNSPVE